MSVEALRLVKGRRFGSTAAKAVVLVLADYADSDWSLFASQARLASEAEVGERTVRRVLEALESQGLIRREGRHRSDGARSSDRTILLAEGIARLPATVTASQPATVTARGAAYRPLTTGLPATVTKPTGQALAAHEPSGEPSEEPSASTGLPVTVAGSSDSLQAQALRWAKRWCDIRRITPTRSVLRYMVPKVAEQISDGVDITDELLRKAHEQGIKNPGGWGFIDRPLTDAEWEAARAEPEWARNFSLSPESTEADQ